MLINTWKRQAVEGMATVSSVKVEVEVVQALHAAEVETLHAKISLLVEERNFAEGLRSMGVDRRRKIIEPEHPRLSIVRQCELVSISRSAYYRLIRGEGPRGPARMRRIDEHFRGGRAPG